MLAGSSAWMGSLRAYAVCMSSQADSATCMAAQCYANVWLAYLCQTLHVWPCSAAAVAQRLSASHDLPAPDVAEALMLHLEACMPAVSQRLATSESTSVQEQQGNGAPSNKSQAAAQEAEKQMYPSPEMQGLGQSWQALADVICQSGAEALEAGITELPVDVEPHNQLAVVDPKNMSAAEQWDRVKLLLESRAWWWDKAVFDVDVQRSFLATGQAGIEFACAMTIVSDLMMRELSKLERSATFWRNIPNPSQRRKYLAARGSWAQRTLKVAKGVLSKLR